MKEIKLTQNKTALVSDQDFDYLTKFRWYTVRRSKTYYARTNIQCLGGKRTAIYMHQLILDCISGYNDESNLEPDHEDRNGLNNQRYNLRMVTHRMNMHNKQAYGESKYRGVSWHKPSNKWRSGVKTKGKNKHLGYFDNEISAAKAYDKAAKEIYGSKALLNIAINEK